MRHCPNCHAEIPSDREKVCKVCGAQLPDLWDQGTVLSQNPVSDRAGAATPRPEQRASAFAGAQPNPTPGPQNGRQSDMPRVHSRLNLDDFSSKRVAQNPLPTPPNRGAGSKLALVLGIVVVVLLAVIIFLLVSRLGMGSQSDEVPETPSSVSETLPEATEVPEASEPAQQPASSDGQAVTEHATATSTQVVFRNAHADAVITVDGEQVPFTYVGTDAVVARSDLKDVCQVRIIAPTADGYETAAVWYNFNYGNDMTFADDYGAYEPSTEDGLARPGDKVVDVLTWAYYLGYLNSVNAQDVSRMTYSTADNSLAQTDSIYDPENADYEYDNGNFIAVCDPSSIMMEDDDTVIYNATFESYRKNRETGETSVARNHRTIRLVWEDGIWKVDATAFLGDADFDAGRYAVLP